MAADAPTTTCITANCCSGELVVHKAPAYELFDGLTAVRGDINDSMLGAESVRTSSRRGGAGDDPHLVNLDTDRLAVYINPIFH